MCNLQLIDFPVPAAACAGRPVHVCQNGCCQSEAEARQKATDLVCKCLLRPIAVPALNKWTKVFPAVGCCVLLASFSDIGQCAFRQQFGKQEVGALSELDSSDEEEDAALNVPINEVKRWIKLAKKRNAKATSLLCDENSRFMNMLWLHIAAPCMRLHWILFKTATWYSDRPRPDPTETADVVLAVRQFCSPKENPGLQVMKELFSQLRNPDYGLKQVCFFFGNFKDWPQARKRVAFRSVLLTLGQLVRKVIEPFLAYPWKLFPLSEPDADSGALANVLDDLFQAPPCCLDAGFSLKVRELLPELCSHPPLLRGSSPTSLTGVM